MLHHFSSPFSISTEFLYLSVVFLLNLAFFIILNFQHVSNFFGIGFEVSRLGSDGIDATVGFLAIDYVGADHLRKCGLINTVNRMTLAR